MGIDQQLQITGVVKDTNGEPMIGVTVMVKGTGIPFGKISHIICKAKEKICFFIKSANN